MHLNMPNKMVNSSVILGRKNVIACHKAGIMKMGDGLFIKVAAEVSKKYPDILYKEEQIDTVCMNLANDPTKF